MTPQDIHIQQGYTYPSGIHVMPQAFSLILDQLLLLKLQKRVWIHIQILFPGFCLCHHSREACFHEKQEGLEGGGSDPNLALSSQSTVRMDTHTLTWKQMWADPTQRARDYTQTEPDMMTLQRTKRLGIVHVCRFIRLVIPKTSLQSIPDCLSDSCKFPNCICLISSSA